MNKVFFFLLITLSITTTSIAQTDTVYYDKFWTECYDKTLAANYRITEKQGDLYLVKNYDAKTNALELMAYCSATKPELIYEGKQIRYSESGKKVYEGNFVKDVRSGIWMIWHEGEKDSLVVDCNIDGTYKNIFIPATQTLNKEMNVSYKIEVMPAYPGGEQKRAMFIGKNIVYPQEAKETGITGTSYVRFVIEKDGSITDVELMRNFKNCADCDQEAIRVVRKMPNWIPGMQFGRAVRVSFNMPLKFMLSK